MTRSRSNRSGRRRSAGKRQSTANDLWRLPSAELPAVTPIVVPPDAKALLRSLGDPPMRRGEAASGYFGTVIERAALVASALGYSADLVAKDAEDDLDA